MVTAGGLLGHPGSGGEFAGVCWRMVVFAGQLVVFAGRLGCVVARLSRQLIHFLRPWFVGTGSAAVVASPNSCAMVR